MSDTVFFVAELKNAGERTSALPLSSLLVYAQDLPYISEAGDRVGLIASSVKEQLAGILLLLAKGKEIVPVNPHLPIEQAEIILRKIGVTTVMCDHTAEKKLHGKFHVLQIPMLPGQEEIKDYRDKQDVLPYLEKLRLILFTSGSSGEPKAVPLTFKNLDAAWKSGNEVFTYSENDCWLQSLPLYHISGFSIFFRALRAGCDLLVPPDTSQNSLETSLAKFPVTHISVVPTQLQRLLDHAVKVPNSLRATFLGGAPSHGELVQRSMEAGWKTVKVFGSTETSAFVTVLLPEYFKGRENSSGRALPGVAIKIGQTDDEDGEILISSDSVTSGYLNEQKLNTEKFKDGYYHTGDIGEIDAEGFLFVHGRKDAAIITGGEKVQPFLVEQMLMKTGRIKSCLVTGIPDKEWGHAVVCAVVFRHDKQIATKILKEELRQFLAPYQIPKKILVLQEMPFDATGKLRKDEVLRLFRETE